MKKELLLVFVILMALFFTEKIGVHAIGSNGKVVTISKNTEDITGDGKEEQIILTGVQMEANKFENLAINIRESNNAHIKIDLPTGYHPSLQFLDFNQDGIKDLFASIPTNQKGSNTCQTVYTIKNDKSFNLGLPEPLILESHFINGYKAQIKIRKTGKSYIFDLKKRKKYYEKVGIFYKGKLNEPTELMVNRFSNLKSVQIGDKIGLKGIQKVTGVTESDTIGYVESTWLYDQLEWKLENVIVLWKK